MRGRVLSLLELGTGMKPELNGRQNVSNCAQLLDFPPGYADSKMESIARFAELGDFFDRPVKLYSSGMYVRLAFSMWTCFEPELLIVDEALSVGDVFFQQKCFRRARELLDAGVSMLFVSHDLGSVQTLCKNVMVLNKGVCIHYGDSLAGIRQYYAHAGSAALGNGSDAQEPPSAPATSSMPAEAAHMEHHDFDPAHEVRDEELHALNWTSPGRADEIGDRRMDVTGIAFRCNSASGPAMVEQGGWLEIFVRWKVIADVPRANLGLAIADRSNRILFSRGWVNAGLRPVDLKAGTEVLAVFKICLDMEAGDYVLMVGASKPCPTRKRFATISTWAVRVSWSCRVRRRSPSARATTAGCYSTVWPVSPIPCTARSSRGAAHRTGVSNVCGIAAYFGAPNSDACMHLKRMLKAQPPRAGRRRTGCLGWK